MIDPNMLKILVCPENRTPLHEASNAAIGKLNQLIREGRVRNRIGQTLSEPLDGGLVRQDGKVLYPIRDEIPVLLVDEGIPLEDLDLADSPAGDRGPEHDA